jgi:HAD superfamily hydrolase (TIGR01509 family)
MSLWEAAEYFIAEFGLRLSPQQICDEINELLDNEYKHQVRLKDGVLDFLRRHEGTKMCIATETDKQLVEYALQRLGIEKYFDFVVTSADVGSSKKSPDIFIRAAERLGVRIDEAVVFEDALHAIRSAKSAGFYVIGVYEASHKEEENEIKSIADKYIYHFRDCEV